MQNRTIKRAIIPIAGLGTRLLPISRVIPKEFIPVAGKPVVQHLVEECYRAGIREIVFIVSRNNKKIIEKYFDARHAAYMNSVQNQSVKKNIAGLRLLMEKMKFHYVLQRKPLGDGHALLQARRFIKKGEMFFVSLGDLLVESRDSYIRDMSRAARTHKGYVIAVDEIHPRHVTRYGIIDPAKRISSHLFQVREIVEKPEPTRSPSNIALIGKYIFDDRILEVLNRTKPDARGEIKLAYALEKIIRESDPPVFAYQIRGRHFDCGDWDGLKITASEFKPITSLSK
jgi:UTP--glucose-1-phosphate uridylyltransferase